MVASFPQDPWHPSDRNRVLVSAGVTVLDKRMDRIFQTEGNIPLCDFRGSVVVALGLRD